MSKVVATNDFANKFRELSEHNQKYIIAIQQALMYAQEVEIAERKKSQKKAG